MIRILTSACLLGQPVRYDGRDAFLDDPRLKIWKSERRLVSFCPEVAGGLPVPRPPAEIIVRAGPLIDYDHNKVINIHGMDVTAEFIRGAREAVNLALSSQVGLAIMADGSPSCGSSFIYDGSFNSVQIAGMGLAASLLEKNGILVFNQNQIDEAEAYLKELEAKDDKI